MTSQIRCTLHQCLGRGGFAEVYLATLSLGAAVQKSVALKVLREELHTQDEPLRRLQDEARIMGLLDHPCIPRAHGMARAAGRMSLVLEVVEGLDLAHFTRPSRLLPLSVAIGCVGAVADALHGASVAINPDTGRALGVVHHDVKPENMRVGPGGQVKLIDFGIARPSEGLAGVSKQAKDLRFTPGYAAPEAFLFGSLGAQADVYSLGVSAYRLTTGERFYRELPLADQVGIAAVTRHYERYLAERLRLVPQGARDLLAVCLAHRADDRPGAYDLRALCDEVARGLGGPTVPEWARGYAFPPARVFPGASLSGQVPFEPTGALGDGVWALLGAKTASEVGPGEVPAFVTAPGAAVRTVTPSAPPVAPPFSKPGQLPAPMKSSASSATGRWTVAGVVGSALALGTVALLTLSVGIGLWWVG